MAKKGNPRALRYVVRNLRFKMGLTQAAFGESCGVDQADISRYEAGLEAPSEEILRRMARAAQIEWPLVAHMCRFFEALVAAMDRSTGANDLAGAAAAMLLATARAAISPLFLEEAVGTEGPSSDEQRREAEEVCAGLRNHPAPKRRRLLAAAPRASRNAALVMELCEESVRAAAREPAEALEWADLALFLAEQCDESQSSRLMSYAHGIRANAFRVLEEYDAADEAIALAWSLQPPAADSSPGSVPEWRLFDLEASLRRAERRFSEALALHSRAFEASQGGEATGRVLLNRSATLEQMGGFEGSLAALEQAAPLLAGTRETRLLRVLRFNTAANLRHLGRYAEAATLLPGIWELTKEENGSLDVTRLEWLEARVAAGLGRGEEAMASLERVQREFTDRKLPYDAALSSLDLAVLWLERGRTAEVRELARGMAWIFKAKGIHREALASLLLFDEAARREAATVELARRVLAEVEKVRRTAPPLREKKNQSA